MIPKCDHLSHTKDADSVVIRYHFSHIIVCLSPDVYGQLLQ